MFWEAFPLVLLAVLIVLLPVGVMSLTASRLSQQHRRAYLALYGAVVLLMIVLVADIRNVFASRLAADLVLLLGGVGLGIYVASLFGLRWPKSPPSE
jgi:hypothetical protein